MAHFKKKQIPNIYAKVAKLRPNLVTLPNSPNVSSFFLVIRLVHSPLVHSSHAVYVTQRHGSSHC